MNPYLIIGALVGALALFGSGISIGIKWSDGRQAVENQHIAEAVDAANTASAQAIAGLKPKYTTIQNEVQREIRTNTVYSDCVIPASGLRLANQALNGGALPIGDSKLPPKPDAIK